MIVLQTSARASHRALSNGAPVSPRASRTRTPVVRAGAPAVAELEVAFLQWLEGRSRSDVLRIGPPSDVTLPLEQALERLRRSTEPLTPLSAHRLGLAHGAPIGTAADRLLYARCAPQGPRCRSFRSASYYLYGLARIGDDGLSLVPDPSAAGAGRWEARGVADGH